MKYNTLLKFYSYLVFVVIGWNIVSEKKECTGSEIHKGKFSTTEECATQCSGISFMFIFGTNDFGTTRCSNEGCDCFCETSSVSPGSCDTQTNDGYRLYKY